MLESLLDILKQAEEDVDNNRVTPIQDTFDDLENYLQTGRILSFNI